MSIIALPDQIAVFPLPGALLLPRARLPLQIFEPRYVEMLNDALKTDARLIGMIQPTASQDRNRPGLQVIGCAGRIVQFTEAAPDRYTIILTGVSRFRIRREISGPEPYLCCAVNWAGFDTDRGKAEVDQEFDREEFFHVLHRYFIARDLSADWETLQKADDELLINSLSMMLDFQPEDKQALLEAPSLRTRRETLVALIEYAMHGGANDGLVQ